MHGMSVASAISRGGTSRGPDSDHKARSPMAHRRNTGGASNGKQRRIETIDVVIETPKESRIKFKYGTQLQAYEIDRILPQGLRFPFNFGFVPKTKAADGDPTDVVLILDEALFPGCHVSCRILGVLQAEQTENGKTVRNDRIVAVAIKDQAAPESMDDVSSHFLEDVERFFVVYHEAIGNRFRVIGVAGANTAAELIRTTAVQ
jgi:inorganic pyrophosphatase